MRDLASTHLRHTVTCSRLLVLALLVLGGQACATAGMSASRPSSSRTYTGSSFSKVIQAVAEVVHNIDAQVLRLESTDEERLVSLDLTQDWRQPRPESAVLHVTITRLQERVQVALQSDILANVAAQDRTRPPSSPEETARSSDCNCARDDKKGTEPRINSALALANMHRTMQAFLSALDEHDLLGPAVQTSAVLVDDPHEGG